MQNVKQTLRPKAHRMKLIPLTVCLCLGMSGAIASQQAETAYQVGYERVRYTIPQASINMHSWLAGFSSNPNTLNNNTAISTVILDNTQEGLYLVGEGTADVMIDEVSTPITIVFAPIDKHSGCARKHMLIASPFITNTILHNTSQLANSSAQSIRFRGAICTLEPVAVPATPNYQLVSTINTSTLCQSSQANNVNVLTKSLTGTPYFAPLPTSTQGSSEANDFCNLFTNVIVNSGS